MRTWSTAFTPELVAVMSVAPGATLVIVRARWPLPLDVPLAGATVATPGTLLVAVTDRPGNGDIVASSTVAVADRVPEPIRESTGAVSVTENDDASTRTAHASCSRPRPAP